MSIVLNNLPIVLDIIGVLFFIWCLKLGYSGGIKYALQSIGTLVGIIVAIIGTRMLSDFVEPIVMFTIDAFKNNDVDDEILYTVLAVIVLFVFFCVLFLLFLTIWRVISKKIELHTKQFRYTKIDRVIGTIIEGIFSFVFLLFMVFVLYKWTGVITEIQIQETIIFSNLLELF